MKPPTLPHLQKSEDTALFTAIVNFRRSMFRDLLPVRPMGLMVMVRLLAGPTLGDT